MGDNPVEVRVLFGAWKPRPAGLLRFARTSCRSLGRPSLFDLGSVRCATQRRCAGLIASRPADRSKHPPVASIALLKKLYMFLRRRPKWPRVEHEDIVRRSRLLVIDDGDFPYLPLFERDGYTMEKWDDVEDLAALETGKFDVILLDLLGVGRAESADEGFGLLEHIRATNPAQIVVAYSNAEWSLEYQPFFEKADAALHKTQADYVEFKRTVDRLLDQRFSLGFYLTRISTELGESSTAEALEKAESAILAGEVASLTQYLKNRIADGATVDRVLMLVQAAAGVAGLWKS